MGCGTEREGEGEAPCGREGGGHCFVASAPHNTIDPCGPPAAHEGSFFSLLCGILKELGNIVMCFLLCAIPSAAGPVLLLLSVKRRWDPNPG